MIPAVCVAVDDEEHHLNGLAKAINSAGAVCHQVHYSGQSLTPIPNVRLVFLDLHVLGSSTSTKANYSALVNVVTQLAPRGPYLVVLWTQYPAEAANFSAYLTQNLVNVPGPFALFMLDKADFLEVNGQVSSVAKLRGAITEQLKAQAPFVGLLNWERRVVESAAETVSTLMAIASGASDLSSSESLRRLMSHMLSATVGPAHVANDPFAALTGALTPVLADRLLTLPTRSEDRRATAEAIENAKPKLPRAQAARLHTAVHVDFGPTNGAFRGAVVPLPKTMSRTWFGSDASKDFGCKQIGRCDWVLIQIEAPCDHANRKAGPLPFVAGWEGPPEDLPEASGRLPVWTSPVFFDPVREAEFMVRANCRFIVALPQSIAEKQKGRYRLRGDLVSDLAQRVHANGSRLGILEVPAK